MRPFRNSGLSSGGSTVGAIAAPLGQLVERGALDTVGSPVDRFRWQPASGEYVAFWTWRRGTGATATSGTSAVAIVPELAPIELYTADARIVGWLAPNGQRVTDVLNSSTDLRLWRPSPGPIEGTSPVDAGGGEGEWQSLSTDAVILAMPPEWRASRQLRLHRRLRRVALTAGPFSVTGNVHLPPGAEPSPHLLRNQRFLPLTDGYVLHTGDPPFEHVVSVVIVNTAHVGQLVPLITLG